jgi:putative tryptophan/tyrosine transport system substrate-binding protein
MCEVRKAAVTSVGLVVVLLAVAVIAEAQQPKKVPRIGFLSGRPAGDDLRIETFRDGLRELGYMEGETIVIERRSAEGKLDRLPDLVAELVRIKVDVIVTGGPQVTGVAKKASVTIPIVMALDNDPVANGFVASLARPGGNITGLSTLAPEISGKQVELLKETVPRLSGLIVVGTSSRPGNAQMLKETEIAAGAFGVRVQYLDVLTGKDVETASRNASKGRTDALLVLGGGVLASHRTQIVEFALKNRLPAIFPQNEFVEAGGLMYYG